jgi:hypothetical protein
LNAPVRDGTPVRTPGDGSGIPVRALLVGCLLLPVNAYWLVRVEMVAGGALRETGMNGPYPTNISLFANVVFGIVLLTVANTGVRRVAPRAALTQADLLLVYIMLSIGTCLTSIDFLDVLFSLVGHATRYASPENQWGSAVRPVYSLLVPCLRPGRGRRVLPGAGQPLSRRPSACLGSAARSLGQFCIGSALGDVLPDSHRPSSMDQVRAPELSILHLPMR